MEKIVCSVVVPVYNEEEVINVTYKRLKDVMDGLDITYEIIFVNDGSRDRTRELAMEICKNDKNIKFIDFSRNFGHQTAITAGMDYASGDAVVVIDADLQDPPEVIPEMLEKWREGYDVVYGQRVKRQGETFFKKVTAKIFYRTLNRLTDVEIPVDTGDFRLIDRKVCDALKKVDEKNRYIRGIISWLGFKSIAVPFVREKRFAGTTKYPLKKMLKFASDAIISFSHKPLKLATYFGFFLSFASFAYLIVTIILKVFSIIQTVPGWASIVAINLFFNGIILLILGIIGEYIGRIYDEAKNRPLYVIRELVNFDESKTINGER
ncbi:MAG TPA: glycosyltransferase family 2 protein [Clostridiaceae bacterium]|jgi:dolichol-phosphate mannosyltransferase|nr:glycosyltransferase family 2 protein [Clostridiaceae bacterium]HOA30692.1 glycosyltransferase family 2 protein [Clostridia bacterium]